MKRLTEKHYNSTDHYMLCSAICDLDMDCVDCPAFDAIVEQLAAYEDTGMEPEEVAALKRQRWIPVTERLPEDRESVLTYKNGIMEVQEYEKGRNGWFYGGLFWSMATVTHWMPLPKPPEVEK